MENKARLFPLMYVTYSFPVARASHRSEATMAMIDTCSDARSMFVGAVEQQMTANFNYQEFLESRLDALQDDKAAAGFRSLINSFEGLPDQWSLVMDILTDCIPPTSIHLVDPNEPKALTEATALRERVMSDRILALCGGAITGGKLRKRIVAVVGASHVRPLRELLLAAGSTDM